MKQDRGRGSKTRGLSPDQKAILSSLTGVGPSKPIGYLPLYTVRDFLKIDPQALVESVVMEGLSATLFEASDCCIKSGALYVYDSHALQQVLNASRSVLSQHGWPIDSEGFVARVAGEWIEEPTALLDVIDRAFGDTTRSKTA